MYDLKTDGLHFAKQYLSGTIDSFVQQLPVVFPPRLFGLLILVSFVSALVFGLLFNFIFGSKG